MTAMVETEPTVNEVAETEAAPAVDAPRRPSLSPSRAADF
jgi:hypothetical protein